MDFEIGQKVEFTESSIEQVRWGGNDDPEKDGLIAGDYYVVTDVEIHSFHTKLMVEGFGGQYNSVSFEQVTDK